MLSAYEAYEKTLANINKCTTKELSKLERQIDEAIDNCMFSISNDGCLQHETRQKLEDLHYEVTTGWQYNEPNYNISWKKAKT